MFGRFPQTRSRSDTCQTSSIRQGSIHTTELEKDTTGNKSFYTLVIFEIAFTLLGRFGARASSKKIVTRAARVGWRLAPTLESYARQHGYDCAGHWQD